MAIKTSGGILSSNLLWAAVATTAFIGVCILARKVSVYINRSDNWIKITTAYLKCSDLLKIEPRQLAPVLAPSNMKQTFQTLKIIEGGTNSKVSIIKREVDGLEFACKEIFHSTSLHETQRLLRETLILQKLNHPNIIKLDDLISNETSTKLLMEYFPDSTDLYFYMRKISRPLSMDLAMKILGQLVMALKYCHTQNIVHRDLKLENILIDQRTFDIKLIDFGLSRYLPKEGYISSQDGTLEYLSPETLGEELYNAKKRDIWAVGVVLYAMVNGALPIYHKDRAILRNLVKEGSYTIPDHLDDQMKDLIKGIMCVDSSKRFSLDQIIQHPLCQKYPQFFVENTSDPA